MKLPRFVADHLARPAVGHCPADNYLARLYAFVARGTLGLWDGENAWLSPWAEEYNTTHFRSGDARTRYKAKSPPAAELCTPAVGGLQWVPCSVEGVSILSLQASSQSEDALPVALLPGPGDLPQSVRSAQRGSALIALICSQGYARALLWRLHNDLLRDLQPPPGYFFTGESRRVPFAQTEDGRLTLEADVIGVRNTTTGIWSSVYRLWSGDRLCLLKPVLSIEQWGPPESMFTFAQGVQRGQLPFLMKRTDDDRVEWSHTYVLHHGYISVNAQTSFTIDLLAATGTFSVSTWEEH